MSNHEITTIRQLLTEYTEGERQGLECWQVSRRYLPAILDRLDALEKERTLFAEHIVKTGARHDHGCIVCTPDTPPHPSGDFVCTFHHAKAALSALTPTNPQPKERT